MSTIADRLARSIRALHPTCKGSSDVALANRAGFAEAKDLAAKLALAYAPIAEPPAWTPTAANINALPEPIRQYVHDLATRCDPAGDVAQMAMLKQQNRELQALTAALPIAEPAAASPTDLITVAHLTLDGSTLTLTMNQLGELECFVGEKECTYELRIAAMTRGEFEDLGDFDGF